MKKTTCMLWLSVLLFCLCPTILISQQILLSKEWESEVGTQFFFRKAKTVIDGSGNVYIVGETVNGNGNYDWLVEKRTGAGALIWSNQFDGAAQLHDLALDVFVDGSGNVFVCGGVTRDTLDSLDICVRKYNSSGVAQWTQYYTGGIGNDVGADVEVHGSGNVYVTGTARTSDLQDIVLIQYNSSGVQQWARLYDYAGYNDVGIRLAFNGTIAIVAGGSQGAPDNWAFSVLGYNSTGTLISTEQAGGGDGVIYSLQDMVMDANFNIYLTGSRKDDGDENLFVAKLDSGLNTLWIGYLQSNEFLAPDRGNAIEVDGAGNVYVAGYTSNSVQGRNVIWAKFDAGGTELFRREFDGEYNLDDGGTSAALLTGEGFYIGGYTTTPQGKDYLLLYYALNGDYQGYAQWNSAGNYDDVATDIALDGANSIVLTGQSQNGFLYEYVTVSYEKLVRQDTFALDTLDRPIYRKAELIVNFNPDIIDTDFIDESGELFARISDVIDIEVVEDISDKLGFNAFENINLIKIYKRIRTTDTISITRLGDTIPVPKFWCSMIMTLPDSTDLYEAIDSLELLTDYIYYAEPNYIGRVASIPNDAEWSNQENLYPSGSFPNGHINVEPAWDFETGEPFIKVGVFDTGINWSHPDFNAPSFTGGPHVPSLCQVKAGFRYGNPRGPMETFGGGYGDPTGHGSWMTGIIGALRNNTRGGAGIAGGDNASEDGCSLYSMSVVDMSGGFPGIISLTAAAEAVVEGAALLPGSEIGVALHIGNSSIGFEVDDIDNYEELERAYYWSWLNGVTQSCARGNSSDIQPLNELVFPACFGDDWVLNIGACGTNGQRMDGANGDGVETYQSLNGTTLLDCTAPGTKALGIITTQGLTSDYFNASGTSAAAAHVSGAAALIMSYYNSPIANFNNLIADDIEFLIERYASDRGTGGYETENGHGILDVGAIFTKIDKTRYDIWHFVGDNPISSVSNLIDGNYPVFLAEHYGNLAPGLYDTELYEVTATFNHTLPVGAVIVNSWPLRSHSSGMPNTFIFEPSKQAWIDMVSINTSTAVLKTYVYKFIENLDNNTPLSQWVPMTDAATRFPYAVHLDLISVGTPEAPVSNIKVYPNPTGDVVNIEMVNGLGELKIQLTDVLGNILETTSVYSNLHTLNLSGYSAGIYMVTVTNGSTTQTYKIVHHE